MSFKKTHSTTFSGEDAHVTIGKPQPEPEYPFTVSTWAKLPRKKTKRERRKIARFIRRERRNNPRFYSGGPCKGIITIKGAEPTPDVLTRIRAQFAQQTSFRVPIQPDFISWTEIAHVDGWDKEKP